MNVQGINIIILIIAVYITGSGWACSSVRDIKSCDSAEQCQWDLNSQSCVAAFVPTPPKSSAATFRFAKVYQDHMVLQKDMPASIWGYATSLTSKIQVSLQCNGKHISTSETTTRQVPSGIVWRVSLPPQQATPSTTCEVMALEVDTKNNVTIHDVLFGDVWLCSGQSNMAFSMGTPLGDPVAQKTLGINSSADIASSINYPLIRLITIGDLKHPTPLPDFDMGQGKIVEPWIRAQPSSVGSKADVMGSGHFSAVCYLFGRGIFQALGGKIPIGLISASWGGTSLECWLDNKTLAAESGGGTCPGPIGGGCCGGSPTQQYNGMIAPLQNVTIKGAIWYQGESNVGQGNASIYTCRFTKMLNQWREQWHQGTGGATNTKFPVGVVQIGPLTGKNPTDPNTFILRQGQTASYGYMPNPTWPNTFLSVAYDLPNPPGTHCVSGCVHIFDKQEVARRLVLAGEKYVYGMKSVIGSGPRISKASFASSAQKQVILTFTEVGDGLKNQMSTNATLGFELLLAKTGKWVKATPESYTKNEIKLSAATDMVSSVRYAFADQPCPAFKCAVYNSAGIPSAPFSLNITQS